MINPKILVEKPKSRSKFSIFRKFQTDFTFLRHKLHKKVFSKIIWSLCSKKISLNILNFIETFLLPGKKLHRIIDVSCGYDDLQTKIAQNFKNSIVIGNDFNSTYFSLLKKHKVENKNHIHTNYDLFSKDFHWQHQFDVVICKNSLHHFPQTNQLDLLKVLCKIGNNIIFVDIENPLHSSLRAFIWNFYYRKFLKDDGINFVSKQGFITLLKMLKEKIPIAKIYIGMKKTIKGNYIFALISVIKRKNSQPN